MSKFLSINGAQQMTNPVSTTILECLANISELNGQIVEVEGVWAEGNFIFHSVEDFEFERFENAIRVIAADEKILFYRNTAAGQTVESIENQSFDGHRCVLKAELETNDEESSGASFKFVAFSASSHLFIDTDAEAEQCRHCEKYYVEVKRRSRLHHYKNAKSSRRWRSLCPHCDGIVAVSA